MYKYMVLLFVYNRISHMAAELKGMSFFTLMDYARLLSKL